MKSIKPDKRASIIIVTYNGSAYLERCLTSVEEDVGADCEIIVVDNASTDNSADFVEHRYPDVILIRNETNRGFAAACNQGARHATGQYLVFLNQDTQVLPGWLSGLLDALERNNGVALVTSKLLLMSQPDRINACGQDIHYTGLNFSRGFLCNSDQFSKPEIVSAVAGASFAIRRDVWEDLGGFDQDLFMYFEETDLSWRAQLAGYQCVYFPTSVAYHDQSFHSSALASYYSERNRHILLLKNWRWPTLLLLLPGIVLAELVDWGYVTLIGWQGIRAKLRAYAWILANLPKIIRSRQCIQRARKAPDWVILENRTYRLMPKLVTGGPIGLVLVRLCNVLFFANYWTVLRICRGLGL